MASLSLDEFKRLKQKADARRAEADRAAGAYDETINRLKSMGYQSVEAAEQALAELKTKEQDASEAYQQKLDEFKAKWGDQLGI